MDLKRLEKEQRQRNELGHRPEQVRQFRCDNSTFVFNHEIIRPGEVMMDLGVYVQNDLTWI